MGSGVSVGVAVAVKVGVGVRVGVAGGVKVKVGWGVLRGVAVGVGCATASAPTEQPKLMISPTSPKIIMVVNENLLFKYGFLFWFEAIVIIERFYLVNQRKSQTHWLGSLE